MKILFVFINLLIVFALIVFVVNRQKALRPGKFGKYGHGSKAKWILGAYGLILL
jgi:hypothetical protein